MVTEMEYGDSTPLISSCLQDTAGDKQYRGEKRRRSSVDSSGGMTTAHRLNDWAYSLEEEETLPNRSMSRTPPLTPTGSSRDWDRPGLMDRILNRDSPPDPPSSPLDEWEASTILVRSRSASLVPSSTSSYSSKSSSSFRLTTPAQFHESTNNSPPHHHDIACVQSIPLASDTPHSASPSLHQRSRTQSIPTTNDCHPDETASLRLSSNRRMSLPDVSDTSNFTFRMPPPPPFALDRDFVETSCPKPSKRLQKTTSDSAVGTSRLSSPRLIRIANPKLSGSSSLPKSGNVTTSPAKAKRKTAQPKSRPTKSRPDPKLEPTSPIIQIPSTLSYRSRSEENAASRQGLSVSMRNDLDEPTAPQPPVDIRNILSDDLKAKFDLIHARMKQEAESSWESYELGAPALPPGRE